MCRSRSECTRRVGTARENVDGLREDGHGVWTSRRHRRNETGRVARAQRIIAGVRRPSAIKDKDANTVSPGMSQRVEGARQAGFAGIVIGNETRAEESARKRVNLDVTVLVAQIVGREKLGEIRQIEHNGPSADAIFAQLLKRRLTGIPRRAQGIRQAKRRTLCRLAVWTLSVACSSANAVFADPRVTGIETGIGTRRAVGLEIEGHELFCAHGCHDATGAVERRHVGKDGCGDLIINDRIERVRQAPHLVPNTRLPDEDPGHTANHQETDDGRQNRCPIQGGGFSRHVE